MKILKGLLLVILLSLILFGIEEWGIVSVLPWWKVVIVTIIVGVLIQAKAWQSFLFGFLAIAIWWGGFAFLANQMNGGSLATRMGQLFNGISPGLLLLITALMGGIAGGLGAMLGAQTRSLISTND